MAAWTDPPVTRHEDLFDTSGETWQWNLPKWVQEWNEAIHELDAEGPFYPPMAFHGKAIPYIGWFWRDVDFHYFSVTLGDCGSFVGFMESNKWGYPQWSVAGKERERLLELVHAIIEDPTKETCTALYDYMQTRPGS